MSTQNNGEGPIDLGKKALQTGEDTLVEIGKAPLEVAEVTVKEAEKIGHQIGQQPPVKQARRYWHILGPGLITGASDDDPSGIATYSQTGAKYGFQLLYLASFTFPMMAAVQEMCARIGLVTGRGLAYNIKKYFPKWLLYLTAVLLLIANSFNIGADLGALAKAVQLILPNLPFAFLIIAFVIISLLLQIFLPYEKYARYLKYLALILLVYVITAFTIKDFAWGEVFKNAFWPTLTFSKDQIILISAILGTTVSPYLFFWQTSQEVEEKIQEGHITLAERAGATDGEIRRMRIDVWSGMFLSNLVMFFIIAVCAATLFNNGITDINSAADAADALRPLAGNSAYLLFAIGVLGTGLLAIPILAGSASYAVSESFGHKEGLYRKFKEAAFFYGIIILSMLIGLAINFIGIDPIKALIYAAVINGLVAPIVLILIVLISSNKNIMGERANSRLATAVGWLITAIMILAGAATIIFLF